MDPSADEIWREENDEPLADNMLLEAERLNVAGLGHPLNFMFTLYYESSFDSTPEEPEAHGREEVL